MICAFIMRKKKSWLFFPKEVTDQKSYQKGSRTKVYDISFLTSKDNFFDKKARAKTQLRMNNKQ